MSIVNRNRHRRTLLRGVLLPTMIVVILVCFLSATSELEQGRTQTGAQQLEQSLRRACVTCYATQGVYPPSLAYLEEHYGLQIDREHYAVFYDIFAENLMPDITVLELES